jgi:hypothetical protein
MERVLRPSQNPIVYGIRVGVSHFFRCEAPLLLRHEVEFRCRFSLFSLLRFFLTLGAG